MGSGIGEEIMYKIKKVCSIVLSTLLLLTTVACQSSEALTFAKKEDLVDQKFAVQAGTVGESLAQELVGEDNASNVESYALYSDAIMALTSKKVSAALMDIGPAKQFVDGNDSLMILPDQYDVEQYAIAIKKGNTELLSQVDEIVETLKADGSIAAIQEKYATTDVKSADIDLNEGAAGGVITMGTEAGFPPYEMQEGDGFIGIDVEIAALIAKALDKELVIENMDFDSLPLALDTGRIDFIAAGMTVTPQRELTTDFTQPYIEDARQVIVIRVENYAGE